jgi:hypothetical protein
MTAEQRKYLRHQAYMHATIVVPGHRTFPTCIVREISPGGARLEVDPNWILPRGFWLFIAGDTSMRYCLVRWREERKVSVDFQADQKSMWIDRARDSVGSVPHRARI